MRGEFARKLTRGGTRCRKEGRCASISFTKGSGLNCGSTTCLTPWCSPPDMVTFRPKMWKRGRMPIVVS